MLEAEVKLFGRRIGFKLGLDSRHFNEWIDSVPYQTLDGRWTTLTPEELRIRDAERADERTTYAWRRSREAHGLTVAALPPDAIGLLQQHGVSIDILPSASTPGQQAKKPR